MSTQQQAHSNSRTASTKQPASTNSTKQPVAYTRLSLDKSGQELGVARQLKEIQELAAAQGVTIARVFSDNSKSAYSGKTRPAYEELRAAVRRGEVSCIYVWDTSRLYRRLRDLINLIPELEEHAVTVQTVRGGIIDLSTASGRFQAQIMASVNEHESSMKAERQLAKNRQRITNDRRPASMAIVPFGYRRVTATADGANVKGIIEPDPKEAAAVKFCFESIVKGYSLARISRELVALGHVGKHGAPLTYARISAIVRNPRYAGYLVYKSEIVGDSAETPIIDRALWEQAQAVLNDPARKPKRGRPSVALMTRLNILKCAYCKKNMTPAVGGKTAGNLYRCQEGCASRNRDLVDRLVFDAVVKFLIEHKEEVQAANNPSDTVSAAVARIEQYEKQIEELTDLMMAHKLDSLTYATATKRLRDAIEALDPAPSAPALSAALSGPAGGLPEAVTLASDGGEEGTGAVVESDSAMYGRLMDLPLESKRALVSELVEKVEISKGYNLLDAMAVHFKKFKTQ